MEIIKAVLFGIVEGITEWLPVSSTGHMILLDEFVKLKGSADFVNVFLVVIQLGAIFAVVLQFWNQLFPFQFKDKNRPVIEMDKMIQFYQQQEGELQTLEQQVNRLKNQCEKLKNEVRSGQYSNAWAFIGHEVQNPVTVRV